MKLQRVRSQIVGVKLMKERLVREKHLEALVVKSCKWRRSLRNI